VLKDIKNAPKSGAKTEAAGTLRSCRSYYSIWYQKLAPVAENL
jgi:hypothetical protein